MRVNKCRSCKAVIPDNQRKLYCPECKEIRKKQQKENCLARKKARALEKKIGGSKLLNDVREAKKLGISYGLYKARQTEGRVNGRYKKGN